MKLKNVVVLFIAILTFSSTHSYGESEVKKVLQGEVKEKDSSGRRKKVMMCHECGKPESECECEGEEHGTKHEDEHEEH